MSADILMASFQASLEERPVLHFFSLILGTPCYNLKIKRHKLPASAMNMECYIVLVRHWTIPKTIHMNMLANLANLFVHAS